MCLYISHELQQQILTHAHADYPNEACGLLVGVGNQVKRVIPVKNIATDPKHNYLIGRDVLNHYIPTLDGLRIIGFYHSHPSDDITPSPSDIKQAMPNVIYVIASRRKLSAWKFDRGRVYAIQICNDNLLQHDVQLSRAQKLAVIWGALLSLMILVLLSISLLPPAPVLP
ncbi:MAG: hypothetical protein Kow00117_21260 [Phototrophicales bacterium]